MRTQRLSKKLTSFISKRVAVLLPASFAVIAPLIHLSPVGKALDFISLQSLYSARGHLASPSQVVMVAIDDQTYANLEASTNYLLPRRHIAEALVKIHSLAPAAVILDMKFPLEKRLDTEGTQKLKDAITLSQAPVWEGLETFAFIDDLVSDQEILKASPVPFAASMYGERGAVLYLGDSSKSADEAAMSPTVRTVVGPNAPEATLKHLYSVVPWSKPLIAGAKKSITIPPVNALINFYGPTNTIQRISLGSLLANTAPEEEHKIKSFIKDKVVIVGYQSRQFARGVIGKDEFTVPVDSAGLFPLEIHATILANLLDSSWHAPAPLWLQLLMLAVLSSLAVRLALTLSLPKALATIILIPVVAWLLATQLFTHQAIFLPGLTTQTLAILAALLVAIVQSFIRSQRFEQKVKQTFKFEIEREI